MATDEEIMKEMLERATNPAKDSVDQMAVQMFCLIVRSNADLVNKAHDLLTIKMFSTSSLEALRAVGLLEECMSKCGAEFQKKTAKFTFLNKLIQLVIDRHSGPATSVEVKKRVMDCLLLWTLEHSDKTKIREAYDNLKKQVNFEHGNLTPSVAWEKRESILGKDDDLVAKLLKQGGEENYKKVNLLIQHRFNQEAKRLELMREHKIKLREIQNTIDLLNEMLDNYSPELVNNDDRDTLRLLYESCGGSKYKLKLLQDSKWEFDEATIEDTFHVYSLLVNCMGRYDNIINGTTVDNIATNNNAKTIDTTTIDDTNILQDLIGDTSMTKSFDAKMVTPTDTISELTDIFANVEAKKEDVLEYSTTSYPGDLLESLDLLEPISVFESKVNVSIPTINDVEKAKPEDFKGLKEIDKLSEDLLKENLKTENRLSSFKKEPEKVTLNDLAKERTHSSFNATSIRQKGMLPIMSHKTLDTKAKDILIDHILQIDDDNLKKDTSSFTTTNNSNLKEEEREQVPEPVLPVPESLCDIFVDLDQVTPLTEGERCMIDDEDMKIVLNFTADRPGPNVSVMVLTAINKSRSFIKEFRFQAGVKKPCKVRLLPATDTVMMATKPFRPAASINQVILLFNPTYRPIDLVGIIQYKVNEDPDAFSEPLVVKDIKFVE
ncbi:ADP-ribosylation factor-binding protein GGA3 isoform X1 [Glossina fuscipes]|uniref:ADP-ribosylation factor-binding protein GGA3 isoform X1 n=1 Tax=Glossina fuscipes TaxID=7396 RepID=A0A9C5YUN0_9MUSC|nr:ADP-ribosylation factor-binding protein GGA3 isoform X1 [Glossina fuscipes]